MARDRDIQRSRLYSAERVVDNILDRAHLAPTIDFYGSTLVVPVERKFGDLEGVQRYVDRVLALSWVRAAWPRAQYPITVRRRKGDGRGHYERWGSVIAIPDHGRGRFTMRETYVLHEVAHHLTERVGEASHGPEYAHILQRLVADIIGPEAGLLLMDSFQRHGVKMLAIAS